MANELASITKHFDPELFERGYIFYVENVWNMKTDPFPTLEQLEAVLPLNIPFNGPARSKRICALYKEYCPLLASSSVEPRSLKHLSRCSVRRWLGIDVDDAVEELSLPDQLKAYLHFRAPTVRQLYKGHHLSYRGSKQHY